MVRHDPDGTVALEQLVCGTPLPELSVLRRLSASLAARIPSDEQAWYRAGASVVGPFVSALVEWTLDQCEAEGIELVAPLMREGYMLAPMLRRAVSGRTFSNQPSITGVLPSGVTKQLSAATSRQAGESTLALALE